MLKTLCRVIPSNYNKVKLLSNPVIISTRNTNITDLTRSFTSLQIQSCSQVGKLLSSHVSSPRLNSTALCPLIVPFQARGHVSIKWDSVNGKRRSIKEVVQKFKRLHWGMWIRPSAGQDSKMTAKSGPRKKRSKIIRFCTKKQSRMLDKMVTSYYRSPRIYPNDPLKYYHEREDFWLTHRIPRDPLDVRTNDGPFDHVKTIPKKHNRKTPPITIYKPIFEYHKIVMDPFQPRFPSGDITVSRIQYKPLPRLEE